MAKTSHTCPLTLEQAEKLRTILKSRGFEFVKKDYTIFAAKKGKLNISVYQKGPKVLIQGKETEDFILFTLEPEIIGEAQLGQEETLNPEMFEPHFGIDESGKGDFFGPLVVAGVYVDKTIARKLIDEGVQDSKAIKSDTKIRKLAATIKTTKGIKYHIIRLKPAKYNELYEKFANLNKLLAWGHAAVIESLLEKQTDCPRAISDQFANAKLLENALQDKGRTIDLVQRTKAESDVAVAAASILARETFINWLRDAGAELEITLPRGASTPVQDLTVQLREKHGFEFLKKVGKTHFRFAK